MSISQERTEQVLKMFINENLNLCGCIGAINGQPYCPCKMARLAKDKKPLVGAVASEKCQINLPTSKL